MTPKVIREIVQASPSCAMLKHEDWPGLEKISALRRFQAEGSMRPISILCGNGGLFLDFEMERGADGAMTGYAFPDMLVDVVRFSQAGERGQGARSVRRPSAAAALRAAAGRRPRRAQICDDETRRDRSATPSARRRADCRRKARAEVDFLLERLARHDPRALVGEAARL